MILPSLTRRQEEARDERMFWTCTEGCGGHELVDRITPARTAEHDLVSRVAPTVTHRSG